MNVNSFISQLRRDARAHPARAVVLAVLVAVGIYFWAPLVAGWIAPEVPAGKSGGAVAKGLPTTNSPPPVPPTTEQGKKDLTAANDNTAWRIIHEAMLRDARTTPDARLISVRNPFEPIVIPDNNPQDSAAKTANASEPNARLSDPTPESLGLALSGTSISGRRRIAIIAGQVVPEGGTVFVESAADSSKSTAGAKPTATAKAGTTAKSPENKKTPAPAGNTWPPENSSPPKTPISFQVVRVSSQEVVLKRRDQEFVLKLDAPQLSGRDALTLGPQDDGDL